MKREKAITSILLSVTVGAALIYWTMLLIFGRAFGVVAFVVVILIIINGVWSAVLFFTLSRRDRLARERGNRE